QTWTTLPARAAHIPRSRPLLAAACRWYGSRIALSDLAAGPYLDLSAAGEGAVKSRVAPSVGEADFGRRRYLRLPLLGKETIRSSSSAWSSSKNGSPGNDVPRVLTVRR